MLFALLGNRRMRLALIPVALFLISLGLPALLFANHAPVLGITLLLWGWWGLFGLNLAWLANLNFIYGVVEYVRGDRRDALISSGVALAFGCFSFATKNWYFNEGYPTPISSLGPGFYMWMSSFAVLLFVSIRLSDEPTPEGGSGSVA